MLLFVLTRWRFFPYIPIIGILSVVGGYSCSHISIARTNDSMDVFSSSQKNCSSFCSSKKSVIIRRAWNSCVCKCVPTSSSFVFKGGLTASACMDNINIRSSIGQCQLILDGNTIASPVPVLDLSVPGTRLLTGPVNGSSTCTVFQEEILVNGTWYGRGGGNLTFTTEKNVLKWSSVSSSPYAGRIVRVQLQCNVSKFCIVIKIQGNISYNIQPAVVSPTSIVTLRPSPASSHVRSVHPTTTSTSHPTRSRVLVPLEPATISPTLATVVMVTSSAVGIPSGGTKAVQDGCERGAWVFCQRFYLVLAAVGTAFLFVLLIILISCACIRRKRRNLRHEKAVFFKSGLTTLKEADSNTEIALIEDIKPANDGHKGQNSEEAFYQNVPRREKPDQNQVYRPLRSSDGRGDSPTTPVSSPGRFSYSSSTNEVILYDDSTDSKQLIKPSQPSAPAGKRLRTFCPSPVAHGKKEFLSNSAVLDTEEEATYETMENKTLPAGGRRRDDLENSSGIENHVFEEDDHRQSHYEVVADEQPNYDNVERDDEEDQPNYETMDEHRTGLVGKNYTERQENYETMDTLSGKEQSNYEIMPSQDDNPEEQQSTDLFYETMEAHDKNPDNDDEKDNMDNKREYGIPVVTEDEHDLLYDIPELSLVAQQQPDDAAKTGTGPTVPNEVKHDDGGEYVYANVPDIQANHLLEQLRNSWHSAGQRQEEADRGNETMAEKTPEKRPSSWNTGDAGKKHEKPTHEEDDEELYSLPADLPKPLPSCLLKGRSSPLMNKPKDDKNQASPKQKARMEKSNSARQANEQTKPRDGAPNRTYHGSPKTSKAGAKSSVPASNMKEKPSAGKPTSAGREGKMPSKKNTPATTKKLKSESGASSPGKPRGASKQRQPNSDLKQGNQPAGLINEQPLYTNLVELENERQTLANQDTDMLSDQQPLYQNVGSMVSHVG